MTLPHFYYAFYILYIFYSVWYYNNEEGTGYYGGTKMINKKLKHYEATYNGVIIEEFDNYSQFFNWLMKVGCWGVRDFSDDTGIIVVEPINKAYLQKLNIIND